MNKDDLLKHFISEKTGKINPVSMRWENIKKHPDIYDYLVNYFPDVNDQNTSSAELLYRIINDIYEIPVCPICGKPVSFHRFDRGYHLFCSMECRRSKKGETIVNEKVCQTFDKKYGCWMSKSDIVKEKKNQTNIARYGGKSPACKKEIADKQVQTYRDRYGEHYEKAVEKQIQTNMKNHGHEFNGQNPEYIQKMMQTCMNLYGGQFNKEKTHLTNKEKYGTEEYLASEDAKQKSKKTMNDRYGVDYALQNPELLEKQKQTMTYAYGVDSNFKRPDVIDIIKSNEVREKQWEGKKRNGTTNTSSVEELFDQFLEERRCMYKRNYKQPVEYPYHADFYVLDYDLYIEIQGHWSHGGHPFNPENADDQAVVEEWKKRSTDINFKGDQKIQYRTAIRTWTETDVKKREIAHNNKINFLEIFSDDINVVIDEFNNYVNQMPKKW